MDFPKKNSTNSQFPCNIRHCSSTLFSLFWNLLHSLAVLTRIRQLVSLRRLFLSLLLRLLSSLNDHHPPRPFEPNQTTPQKKDKSSQRQWHQHPQTQPRSTPTVRSRNKLRPSPQCLAEELPNSAASTPPLSTIPPNQHP